jgi:hypothetical protein
MIVEVTAEPTGKFGMTSISERENREIEAAIQVDSEKREDEDDLAG